MPTLAVAPQRHLKKTAGVFRDRRWLRAWGLLNEDVEHVFNVVFPDEFGHAGSVPHVIAQAFKLTDGSHNAVMSAGSAIACRR